MPVLVASPAAPSYSLALHSSHRQEVIAHAPALFDQGRARIHRHYAALRIEAADEPGHTCSVRIHNPEPPNERRAAEGETVLSPPAVVEPLSATTHNHAGSLRQAGIEAGMHS